MAMKGSHHDIYINNAVATVWSAAQKKNATTAYRNSIVLAKTSYGSVGSSLSSPPVQPFLFLFSIRIDLCTHNLSL